MLRLRQEMYLKAGKECIKSGIRASLLSCSKLELGNQKGLEVSPVSFICDLSPLSASSIKP